jgi:hypothetical protein
MMMMMMMMMEVVVVIKIVIPKTIKITLRLCILRA